MSYISKEKLEELKKELEKRKTVTRQELSTRIKEAQAQGEIAENAEYEDAKEAQSFNEGRIIKLERLIIQSKIVKEGKARAKGVVCVGSKIIVKNHHHQKFEFVILGSEDANPIEGKISDESPLGRAFLGRKQKDEVEVVTPKGKVKYKIIKIK